MRRRESRSEDGDIAERARLGNVVKLHIARYTEIARAAISKEL